MTELSVNTIGIIAGVCTTISLVPQLIKILKSGHARDISLSMYIIFTAGVFLWLVYGILIRAFPVILANGVSFVFSACILTIKIKYGKGSGG